MPIYETQKSSYKYHFKDLFNLKVTDTSIIHQPYTPRNITQRDVRDFIRLQEELGFEAAWMITYHYFHPSECMYSIKERKGDISKGVVEQIGYKTNDGRSIWAPSGDNKIIRMRNDPDQVSNDCKHFINVILKEVYGIPRPQKYRGELPPILAFHEMGKEQYHTHLVLPKPDHKHQYKSKRLHDATGLDYLLNTKVRRKCKSLSKWKDIDIREVDNQYGLMGYLNKQTKPEHTSLDVMSSILPTPDAHNPIVKRYKKRSGMNRTQPRQYKYHTHHGIKHFI